MPADNFQDQMKRELAYREEMVQQLQIVRGAAPPRFFPSSFVPFNCFIYFNVFYSYYSYYSFYFFIFNYF